MDRTELALCVDVLGSLALRVDGADVDVPGVRRRALLAVLALQARPVSAERLIDALWPDDPPDNALQALYNHVSRLRGHLGSHGDRLSKEDGGYRLRLEPYELDADAARRLAASNPGAALSLWRGQALEEFRSLPALEVEAVALDELHRRLVDDELSSRLGRGDPSVAMAAAAAAAAEPFRETTAILHVRALAESGRTAEAMAAAQAFRRRLVDETGLDPSPALAALEQQVAAGTAGTATRRVARPDGPMVGRQHDREEVLRLLSSHAVVTLTGPGGVGKTRLALDVASDIAFPDAVVVPLARVDRADRVLEAAASTLGLRTTGVLSTADLAEALADRDLLIVLDNCEHLVEACREFVAAVRRLAPGVRVLATSRVTLHAPGEYVVRLQPLPVPRDSSDLDALRRQPGVRAFVEHARRRRPGYEVAADEATDLVEVLRRLDGLPLGIELAARQVAVMPLSDVRARLDRALDLATGRLAPEDERQRTLRATIESSYSLLTADEQWLLRAISPFLGGVDLETVEVLGAALSCDPLDVLHRLVDSSLLVADAVNGRYRLLFIVRAFLGDELARFGETRDAHRRFVDRCLAIAEDLRDQMGGPDEAAVNRRLRAELDNFRSARDLADTDAKVGITLALEQVVVWRDLREVWGWAVELAEDPALAEHPSRTALLAAAAEASRLVGDFEAASAWAAAARTRGGDESAVRRAVSVEAVVAHFRGDFAAARDGWLRAADGPGDVCAFVGSAALAASYGGDAETARTLLDRGHAMVGCGTHRAFMAYVEGELRAPEDAIPFYEEAITEAARVGCSFVEGVARVSLASARARIGDVAGAAKGFGYLLEFWRRTGQATQLWTTARNAAELLASVGRLETAALLLIRAEGAPEAAAVGPEIARFTTRAFLPLAELASAEALADLRQSADELGNAGVLDRAIGELAELARA